MSENSKSTLPHGASKHFTSSESKTAGAANAFSHLIHAEHNHDENTIIDIKVSNPLKQIVTLLKDIKRRQATTFSLKFTIPLVALPVFILAAFQVGRYQTSCAPVFSTKSGLLKTIVVDVPTKNDNIITTMLEPFISIPKLKTGVPLESEIRSILVNPQQEIVTVLHSSTLSLTGYQNRNVLVTGNFSSCSNVITLESDKNITVL